MQSSTVEQPKPIASLQKTTDCPVEKKPSPQPSKPSPPQAKKPSPSQTKKPSLPQVKNPSLLQEHDEVRFSKLNNINYLV